MQKLKCICKGLKKPDVALLIIRIGVGGIFIMAGIQKLSNMEMTSMMFGQMGFGVFWAWAVAILETLGGLAVLLGAGTMIASAILVVIMIVASIVMIRMGGFMAMMSPFAYLFASLSLIFSGAGRYSLESRCSCWKSGTCDSMSGDCACGGTPDDCGCPTDCSDCDCNAGQSDMTVKTTQCVCSNGVCVCDSSCEDCGCEK